MHKKAFSIALPALKGCLVVVALGLVSTLSVAQATNASLTGTYTLMYAGSNLLNIEINMNGQQVGFCGAGQLPFGYGCFNHLSQDVLTGTLVADGNGHIVTGSSFTKTADPNSYQCSPTFNPAPNCPYKVPSGIAWKSTTSYVTGNEVDLKNGGGTLITYQAAKANLNIAPAASNTCSNSVPPPSCTWVQLYKSATNKNSSGSGNLTGTYTVQSNGSGVAQFIPSAGTTGNFAFVVPIAPVAVGQEVPMVGLSLLGSDNEGSGSAVRVK